MSARSSLRDLGLACALAACGPSKPEADPAKATQLAGVMARNNPTPGAVHECAAADLAGGMTLTFRTLLAIAGEPISKEPEQADWINPPELDAAAATTLANPNADAHARRQAAAELLAAPSYVVYRVDMVNAPLALGVKELKPGTIGSRVIRFDRAGTATCARVFVFQNSPERSQWAIAKSDKAGVDPLIAKALRDDLAAQYVKLAPRP